MASHPLSQFFPADEDQLNADMGPGNLNPISGMVNPQNSLFQDQLIENQMEVEVKSNISQNNALEDKDLGNLYLQNEKIRCYKDQAFEAEAKYEDTIQKLKDLTGV